MTPKTMATIEPGATYEPSAMSRSCLLHASEAAESRVLADATSDGAGADAGADAADAGAGSTSRSSRLS